ncbi:Formate hydrogenlyase subunit [Granulibacter bethesdensis]|uniref:Formate hydrogenlyase subunit n=1 Tax=Granulibacter bethesdensis TaxID=364410 RepID=A0AAC9KG55_9PROT|nr:hypothetical protein [Granulibacter bethesdensis]APH55718.1 Formate hydrogenlyase subunit [Granulibacter bethesdensis]APH63303.1 Formate hydrogenlyase subunit [Granulibacter bethesdensis]
MTDHAPDWLSLLTDPAWWPWLLPLPSLLTAALSMALSGWQGAAWAGLVSACLTLGLAGGLAAGLAGGLAGASLTAMSADPAAGGALLTALISVMAATAWLGWCADEVAAMRISLTRLKILAVGQQTALAGILLAFAPSPWAGWAGISIAMAVLTVLAAFSPSAAMSRRGETLTVGMMACLLSLFGLIILQASSSGLLFSGQGHGLVRTMPGLICLAAGLAVPAGLAPVHQWLRETVSALPPPGQALITGGLPAAALLFMLKQSGAGMPPFIYGTLGILSVLAGAVLAIRCGFTLSWRWSGPLSCLGGGCLAGGSQGLLYPALGLLALSACLLLDGRARQVGAVSDHTPSPQGHGGLDALRLAARFSLAGLPGGTLAGLITLLSGTALTHPLLALLLAAGLGSNGYALLRQAPMLRPARRPPTPSRACLPLDMTATLPALILLLTCILLGLGNGPSRWFASAAAAVTQ